MGWKREKLTKVEDIDRLELFLFVPLSSKPWSE